MTKVFDPFPGNGCIGLLHSSPAVKRYDGNPSQTSSNVPFPCNLSFNADTAKFNGRCNMAFRVCENVMANRLMATLHGLLLAEPAVLTRWAEGVRKVMLAAAK